MDTVLPDAWTIERFLAWEDRQEGKHEFDGRDIIPMTGGSIAHQRIVRNLLFALAAMVNEDTTPIVQEMRLQAGRTVRYPDVMVCANPIEQTVRTVTDALAIFEVLSGDTAAIDRVDKLLDYAALPSLRCYVLLEQTAVSATLFQREAGGAWTESTYSAGPLTLPGLEIGLSLPDLYRGLSVGV